MNRAARHWRRRKAQQGAALIGLAAMLVMGSTWLAVSKLIGSSQERVIAARSASGNALQEAKRALIGYVATRALDPTEHSPGRLPCPEDPAFTTDASMENDGVAATTCTLPAVGRLPWRTLGLPKLLDGAGEPLWYVVSAGWALTPAQVNPPAIQLNADTRGQLTVDGFSPATPTTSNTVAALIIAPGAPLAVAPNANQTAAGCVARNQRRGSMPPDLRDYLECENATSPANATFVTTVVDNATNPVMNDQVVSIAPWEIFEKAEASIAERIERDLVPWLQTYATTTWTANPARPVFPFAAPFSNPSTSLYAGAVNTYQGLVPFVRGQCTAGVDPRCDPTLVAWNTASISVSKAAAGSTPNTDFTSAPNCSASTGTQIRCTINFQRLLCVLLCTVTMRIDIAAPAANVGMGFKTPATNFGGSAGWTNVTTPAVPTALATDGSVPLSYRGELTAFCFLAVICSGSGTVTIPLPTFPDHFFLNPSPPVGALAPDAWWWFFYNNWHHMTYYAVAPNHSPNAAVHSCTDTGLVTCLSIANLAPANKQRAVLIFAGRSIGGAARPNGTLADYVDSVNVTGVAANINQDADTAYYRATRSPAFNDLFIVLSANP